MKQIIIYTDGACRGNGQENNIGAYGIVLIYQDHRKEFKKAFRNVTNNIMELSAVIESLKLLKEPCEVKLYTDSAYIVNAINNKWLVKWQNNGWQTKTGPVKNKNLWLQLLELLKKHKITFIKVKGHSDNENNNRCDQLANEAMDEAV